MLYLLAGLLCAWVNVHVLKDKGVDKVLVYVAGVATLLFWPVYIVYTFVNGVRPKEGE